MHNNNFTVAYHQPWVVSRVLILIIYIRERVLYFIHESRPPRFTSTSTRTKPAPPAAAAEAAATSFNFNNGETR